MKILAIEKEVPGVKEKQFIPFLKVEAMQAWKLYQAGKIREFYFTKDDCAILILECEDEPESVQILNSLPLVKKGLIEFDIIPLLPYPGFNRLFEK